VYTCITYTRRVGGGAYLAQKSFKIPLQPCGYYKWAGQKNEDWLVHRSVEVNEYLVQAKIYADFGAATHPGVGGGTHRRRATFDRC